MYKSIPPISKYMTPMPHSIGPEQTIAFAKKTMQGLHVHHLPVRSGGKLVGIITERDINLLSGFRDKNLEHEFVKDAMTFDPYVVTLDCPLDEACSKMAENRIGSILVVQENGTLVGIFTEVDAIRTLGELLSAQLKEIPLVTGERDIVNQGAQ